ncbi:putative baseplate assembly protein [Paenibacillus tyrfis]|uniref:putative baseplate assembly protein n=1 Tax=Paenibacillus tyrfis TaxID=1501230 RepID=UPI000B58FFD4|nr:putative baseplate assembly protein [Paenibacillus tyrfis]
MLKLPNLDDRLYEHMVEAARKQIPALYPAWTDENAHDPGMTMLEMLTWLIEMQQYYLNRVTEANELKFLKLLGVKPRGAVPASVEVHFEGVDGKSKLPRGTKLSAGGLIFETSEPLLLVPAIPDKLIVATESGYFDYTASNEGRNVSFPAFGAKGEAGSRLYIGFTEPLPTNQLLTLSIRLYENYPIVPVQDTERERIPSAKLEWRIFGDGGEDRPADWRPVDLRRDETNHLSQSGKLLFRLERPMQPKVIGPASDRERYWICCEVVEAGFELPPKIEHVAFNAVMAFQHDTWSLMEEFDWDGRSVQGQSLEISHYLAFFGAVRIQVRTEAQGEWEELSEAGDLSSAVPEDKRKVYALSRNVESKTVRIAFREDAGGQAPPDGIGRIRVICHTGRFRDQRRIGTGNGLPHQRCELPCASVVAEAFRLQIGEKDPVSREWLWYDWHRVDDFDRSGPEDRHFLLDPLNGIVLFGDNEKGMAPPPSDEPNIVVMSLRSTEGVSGNINAALIQRFAEPWPEVELVRPVNRTVAAGGCAPETLEEAKLRARRELQQPATAVTAEDVERIVLNTPGLRVARARALPLFRKGLKQYPADRSPAALSVVVVPYSESPKPMPSRGFMETVRRHLDKRRMITTDIQILPPEYIEISVHAVIVVEPSFKDETNIVIRELTRLLQPFDNKDGTSGWAFGRTMYKGDIYGVINRIPGVSYIQDLWISAEGKGFHKDADGDIQIPPYGLVYSGDHDIELISLTEL